MRKSGVVSVIVPVYGVEAYLEECIESIRKQTYPQLEVILVDDGSPDGCGRICDRYGRMDPRIVVVHQENAGAAAARNTGLRIATGEYITFVDGDDFPEPEAYALMVQALLDNHADIVQGSFRYLYTNGSYVHGHPDHPCHFTAEEYLVHSTLEWTCALCWDKLFRYSVLEDVFFETGHLVDDEFFTYQAVMNAEKITFLPAVIYNYRQRASGVMKIQTTLERKNLDIMNAVKVKRNRVTARFPQLQYVYDGHYADHLLWLAASESSTGETIHEIKKRLLAFLGSGSILFWKKGHRKRTVRILSFLLKRTDTILKNRDKEAKNSEYKFFE